MDNVRQITAILAAIGRGLREVRLGEHGLPNKVRFTLFYDGGTVEHETEVKEDDER